LPTRGIYLFDIARFPVFLDTGGLIFIGLILLLQMGDGVLGILGAFLWIVAIYGSILAHELGHAVVGRRLGYGTADIVLSFFGGVAIWSGRTSRSRRHQLLVTLAGPAVNVVLCIFFYLLMRFPPPFISLLAPSLRGLIDDLYWINLMLAAFNILPIFPLDGGQALRTALAYRIRGSRLVRISLQVSFATLGLVMLYAVSSSRIFLVFILAQIAFQNWQEWQQVRR
jgi:Zn-dependent protease